MYGNGSLIGPFFINGNLNGNIYYEMLVERVFPALVENFEDQFKEDHFHRLWWARVCTILYQFICLGTLQLRNSGPSAYESELLGREQIIGIQMCHDSFFDERLHYFSFPYNRCKADRPVVFRFVLRTFFLYIGETFALFHSVGISPSSIVLFSKSEIGFDRLSASSIRSFGEHYPDQHDLFTFLR